ncbi:hypothetical protein QYF36_003135 [Acer negundo]|nr:hypothetical protein QYF36_003135 [Acer negundo]
MNNLHGSIPNELRKLSGLGFFQLYGNNLSEIFAGGVNSFTGKIPASLSNASKLQILDFAINGLTSSIPGDLGRLQGLDRLNFDDNRLGRGDIDGLNFLTFLANCSSLKVLANFDSSIVAAAAAISPTKTKVKIDDMWARHHEWLMCQGMSVYSCWCVQEGMSADVYGRFGTANTPHFLNNGASLLCELWKVFVMFLSVTASFVGYFRKKPGKLLTPNAIRVVAAVAFALLLLCSFSIYLIARFLFEASNNPSKNQPISVGLKGSIGYIPPEYMGDPSMFFEEENDEEISPNHKEEKEIISDNDPQGGTQSGEIEEHLVSVMRIGLACSTTSPRERMPMKDILKNLYAIRDSFLRSSNRNRRRLR